MTSDEEILATAKTAGLQKALAACHDDVFAAARSAVTFRKGLGTAPGPRAEPWPPMRVMEKP